MGAISTLNAEAEVNAAERCLRTSFSHRCWGYTSCSANGLGVVSLVLPSFARGLGVHTNLRRHEHAHKSQPWGCFIKQWNQQHWMQHLSDLFCSFMTSAFQIWLCTCSSAPHIAINNESVARSMRPCKIQHNAASVTSDVITSSPCDLRVNVISVHVNARLRFDPYAWWTGHT